MKANELRKENSVYLICEGHEGEPDIVVWGIMDYEFYSNRMEDIEPIPLTEEWLLKFGFEKTWYGVEDALIELQKTEKGYILSINCNEYTEGKEFYYVHQLQNLYFALTGEELTIKELVNED